MRYIPVAAILIALLACTAPPPLDAQRRPVRVELYPWLAEWQGELPPMARLEDRFPTPEGCEREAAPEGSFASWLRGLPVRLDRTVVIAHDGLPLLSPAAAVVVLDLGEGDLQQCADTIIRLHAEFLWTRGRSAEAVYHFTSGDPSAWSRWLKGERFHISGSRVERLAGPPRVADHASFRGWLQHLFTYAGTLSLRHDSEPVPLVEEVRAGDFFVEGGSPGHAVMVVDVIRTGEGRRLGLIAQGYTPAQELHVLEDHRPEVIDGVWHPLPGHAGEALVTPSWAPFPRTSARRFSQ